MGPDEELECVPTVGNTANVAVSYMEDTMSRTDKDMPLWVRARRWVPEHYACEHAEWRRGRRACDLPATPDRTKHNAQLRSRAWYRFPGYWAKATPNCFWSPDLRSIYPDRLSPGAAPPKWFVDHIGHNMERRRKRDECIQARKEHRATGDVDVVPTTLQHRHQASWLYW